ncbi:MAG TPA: nuclear transport factor 2 family protein [Candidatus Dormibacteraeota bacterium]|nr:nuclear transport factor 2 family protein [Candidatus Dormibacteraeota bacterium]
MATTATDHPNAALFRQGYEAFGRGDLDTLRQTFDPNIVWHVSGRSRFSGDKRGVDETLAFFGQLFQESGGTFKLDVHDVVANDEHAVAIVTSHIEKGGRSADSKAAHIVHIRDGKLTESWFFAEDPDTFDELFPA